MKKVLITGAGSYIGISVESYLRRWPDAYLIDTVDMLDAAWREKSFSGYDAVFHVAGIAHSDRGRISAEQEQLYYAVNTNLTIETAKRAKADGVKQFIFMSSAIVYGDSAPIGKSRMITRETPLSPANCYGNSKMQAERGILPLGDNRFHVVILRPPMIYGQGCRGNYPMLVRLACKLPIFPRVANQRSMLYIENLCEFVRLMVDNEEQGIFWPQNAEYSNTSELVRLIARAHGRDLLLTGGVTWLLKLLSRITGLVNKAFGSLTYDQQLSAYPQAYQIVSLEDSIRKTEGKL